MITAIVGWLLVALAVERITEIITMGVIFERPRHWILQKNNFWSDLIGCGYCLSVWVSAIFAWSLPGSLVTTWALDVILKTFAIHGLANFIHEMLKRWFEKIPWVLAFQRIENDQTSQRIDQPSENTDGITQDSSGLHAGKTDDGAQGLGGGDEEGPGYSGQVPTS